MIRFLRNVRTRAAQRDFWLADQFGRQPAPVFDAALATWSELLGDAGAKLWMDACNSKGQRS
jgi:alpha-beta hydrolase superfamily lysophospholipase